MSRKACVVFAFALLALVLVVAMLASCPTSQCEAGSIAVEAPLAPNSTARPLQTAVIVTAVETPAPRQVPFPPQ